MPDVPDLAALREKANTPPEGLQPAVVNYWVADVRRDELLAVLDLVEEQRKENERLRGSLKAIAMYHPCRNLSFVQGVVENALAGSPADTKEQP